MDIFLLGAGKPALGKVPSVLKEIAQHASVLDLQLDSLSSLANKNIHFLGGYHIADVIEKYPQLSYTVVPDWAEHSVIHTLLRAPLREQETIICYSDTIFRKKCFDQLCSIEADVVFAYDSHWEKRYEHRTTQDINKAETIIIRDEPVEFTGLIKLSGNAAAYVSTLSEDDIESSLIDLIEHLRKEGFQISEIDVRGNWTELNSPNDIAHFLLGTKATTLKRLAPLVKTCKIGDQFTFTIGDWENDSTKIISHIQDLFKNTCIIIRSSAFCEDSFNTSYAGHFDSVGEVNSNQKNAITDAVDQVIRSYKKSELSDETQILVQAQVQSIQCAGVILTCGLDTGSPYYIINMDDKTASTDSVTSGAGSHLRTIIIEKAHARKSTDLPKDVAPIIRSAQELETILHFQKLDIEFAVDQQGIVHIFQVRPITVDHSAFEVSEAQIHKIIQDAETHFNQLQAPNAFTVGEYTYFGNMPDWNPAEIIGTRPTPLAYSLYRYLITDHTWATQRAESGYRDIRPHPLLVAFCGQPYVDIRASFNTFIPAKLPESIAEKVIHAYLSILKENPTLHDKIEFDIALTCWTPSFSIDAEARLLPRGISKDEINALENALKDLTRTIITDFDQNTSSIHLMRDRFDKVLQSPLPSLKKALSLLNDCQRYGTLAFAHAARAAFVANSFLKSAEKMGMLSQEEHALFLSNLNTVTGEFDKDCQLFSRGELDIHHMTTRYGHLRPGTYNINTPAYWENPELYFNVNNKHRKHTVKPTITECFIEETKKSISRYAAILCPGMTPDHFMTFLQKSIQSREYVKFEFTRHLSAALDLMALFGSEHGLSKDQISFLEVQDLMNLDNGALRTDDLPSLLTMREKNHLLTKMVTLPSLLFNSNDFYCFERSSSQPNFITQQSIQASCEALTECKPVEDLGGKIILISHADPGYDWLFNHAISGLITQYGGANSHMAIRAAEMGLPAAIGVGEQLFEQLINSHKLHLDCANATINIID